MYTLRDKIINSNSKQSNFKIFNYEPSNRIQVLVFDNGSVCVCVTKNIYICHMFTIARLHIAYRLYACVIYSGVHALATVLSQHWYHFILVLSNDSLKLNLLSLIVKLRIFLLSGYIIRPVGIWYPLPTTELMKCCITATRRTWLDVSSKLSLLQFLSNYLNIFFR